MTLSRIALTVSSLMAVLPAIAYAENTPDVMIEEARVDLGISDDECQSSGRQIVVCASQNDNDRYRLPFETFRADDPANEGVWAERERIQANPGTCQSWAANRTQCGMAGVSFGVGANSGFRTGGFRRVGQ